MRHLVSLSRTASFPWMAVLLVFGTVTTSTTPTNGNEPARKTAECTLREFSSPEFWVVNTRCAPRCSDLDAGFSRLTYQRWCPEQRCFINETLESFLVAQGQLPTLLYVHGNSLNHENALESAWKMYNRVKVCPGPKMLVLWSWPAEIIYKRPLIRPIQLARKNIKAKYVYVEYQGYYLAKLVDMMSTELPLTLGGHSYGGACCLVASHFLGGGTLNGLCYEGGSPTLRPNLRASLISPALDNDHLYPGHRYQMAMYPLEKLHTTYNTNDATLKRWPTHSFREQKAMGYTGICTNRLGENAYKVCQQRLDADVGRSHYIKEHLASLQMISAVCQTAFNSTPVPGAPGSSTGRSLAPGASNLDLRNVIEAPAQIVFPGLAL
ncbi:MAG: hypothetical protein AB8B50_11750 [Pirellulaceae bacterium]